MVVVSTCRALVTRDLEPHPMDQRVSALLHKPVNSHKATFQKLHVFPFSSEKDSEPYL